VQDCERTWRTGPAAVSAELTQGRLRMEDTPATTLPGFKRRDLSTGVLVRNEGFSLEARGA
jgi:hypothetical protein